MKKIRDYLSKIPRREEPEPRFPHSLVMYNLDGILAVFSSTDRKSYDADIAQIKSEGRELIFAEYDLSEDQYNMALKELKGIQFGLISEVSGQVEGLVAKLKEGK